ncbi:restriction endonuclease subunit S [Acinetobacter faecalis]|uniref:restriction endonuclease subunit S n=1 Tax=Acinetobacter faecalis TaxID=2665161 RepID=UPI002A920A9A|nr:restriction endonuclease subunit S [Acinetobacter faecalis]MDY6511491.1 restriction endonuclease subunit S [Acinetobacter faecalis]
MAAPKLRFKEFDGDWTGLKIKDLVKSLDAGVSVNSEDVEPQEYEYSVLKTSCISSGYFDENERKRVLQDGEIQRLKEPVLDDSILMSRMNTPLLVGMNAYVFKAPKNTFLPDRLWQLKIDNNKTVTRWLAFYLGSDQGLNQIRDLASGTSNSMKNITKPDVLNIDLFAPQKEEQTKIASFLSNVDEKISQLTQKHQLLSQYKQGMMQKLFSQQIRFKADDGSEFGAWKHCKLKDVLISYRLGGNYSNAEMVTSYPLIKMGNLGRGSINLDKIEYIPEDQIIDPEDLIKKNDLFFNTRNTLDLVGKVALWRGELPIAYYNSNLLRLDFENNIFMNYLFNEQKTLEKLKAIASGTTSVAAIYTKDLLKINLEIPCLEEQNKIASFLSSIDQKIEVVAQQIEQAKTWKKGLLQQMFV